MRCRTLEMLPVECIARGYLAGLGAQGVREDAARCPAWRCPPGLVEGSRAAGADLHADHEGAGRRARRVHHVRRRRGPRRGGDRGHAARADAGRLRARRRDRRGRAGSSSPTRSWSSAATPRRAAIVLADEVLTPDSSRFWPADRWAPGRPAVLLRQAVRARLVGGLRLGPHRPGPGDPGRGRRGDPRPLRRGLRAAHRRSSRYGGMRSVTDLNVSLSGRSGRRAAVAALAARGVPVTHCCSPPTRRPSWSGGCANAATPSPCTGTTTPPARSATAVAARGSSPPAPPRGRVAADGGPARADRARGCGPMCSCRRASWRRTGPSRR